MKLIKIGNVYFKKDNIIAFGHYRNAYKKIYIDVGTETPYVFTCSSDDKAKEIIKKLEKYLISDYSEESFILANELEVE